MYLLYFGHSEKSISCGISPCKTPFLAYFPTLKKIEYAYEITLLSVCLCISPIVARQRLGKSSLIVARQQLHVVSKESRRLVLPRTSC
jgi:hypothetical protein